MQINKKSKYFTLSLSNRVAMSRSRLEDFFEWFDWAVDHAKENPEEIPAMIATARAIGYREGEREATADLKDKIIRSLGLG